MEIPGFRKKAPVSGRLPVKRTINFATAGEKPANWTWIAIAAAAAVVFAVFFVKFAVLNRLEQVSLAQEEVRQLQEQVDAGYAALSRFESLEEAYAHYTWAGMTEDELRLADRVEVMRMIQSQILPFTAVDSWVLSGNSLTVHADSSDLQSVNLMVQRLLDDPVVSYCTVATATASPSGTRSGDVVTAQIVIYLRDIGAADDPPDTGEEAAS